MPSCTTSSLRTLGGWRVSSRPRQPSVRRAAPNNPHRPKNVPVPARLAARLSLVNVKRAVSRDGRWSPDSGDSFAKIHSGLVVDCGTLAASDREAT